MSHYSSKIAWETHSMSLKRPWSSCRFFFILCASMSRWRSRFGERNTHSITQRSHTHLLRVKLRWFPAVVYIPRAVEIVAAAGMGSPSHISQTLALRSVRSVSEVPSLSQIDYIFFFLSALKDPLESPSMWRVLVFLEMRSCLRWGRCRTVRPVSDDTCCYALILFRCVYLSLLSRIKFFSLFL